MYKYRPIHSQSRHLYKSYSVITLRNMKYNNNVLKTKIFVLLSLLQYSFANPSQYSIRYRIKVVAFGTVVQCFLNCRKRNQIVSVNATRTLLPGMGIYKNEFGRSVATNYNLKERFRNNCFFSPINCRFPNKTIEIDLKNFQ